MTTRHTSQRDAIRSAFESTDRPMSQQELLALAQKHVPGLGIATVYRNINALVEEGWLVPVVLPGEPARYERAGKDHHHHFHCRRCDRVYEVDGCPGNLRHFVPKGFKLETHELVLNGLCAKCA